jgi:large subunit ribosomal protein L1
MRLKPSSAKGTYVKTVAVATTMGPGIKVDPVSIRKFLDG